MSWQDDLRGRVEKTRIGLICFPSEVWRDLGNCKRGHYEFTFVRPHNVFKDVRPPMLFLVMSEDKKGEVWAGVATSSMPVASLETRIKITRCLSLTLNQMEIVKVLSIERDRNALSRKLEQLQEVSCLPPSLSFALINSLIEDKRSGPKLRTISDGFKVSKIFSNAADLQEDGIRLALNFFGMGPSTPASELILSTAETRLSGVTLREDSVIEHDARLVPGFNLIGSHPTGYAEFDGGNSRLRIYTANKQPLEEMFGVDLIYFNETRQSIIMVQYKMLDRERVPSSAEVDEDAELDWIYRPDSQLKKELDRMKKFRSLDDRSSAFRLNPDPFYLKFVRRNGSVERSGFITALEHFERLMLDPSSKGQRGGVRISDRSLCGQFLRQSSFIDLLRSGYIGSRGATTDNFMSLIRAVSTKGKGLVAAIQNSAEFDNETEADVIDQPDP